MTDIEQAAKKRRAAAAKMLGVSVEELDKKLPEAGTKARRKLFLKVSTMSAVENKHLLWAIRHILLAAALNMFTGNPDVGKTLVAIYYIAALSRQGKKIVIICREDDYGSMWKPRLAVANANLDNIIPVFNVGLEGDDIDIPWMLDDSAHLELLRELLTEHKATMCLIDPLADFTGKLDLNKSGDVRTITGDLTKIAKKTGAAIVVNCHSTKALIDNAIKAAAGSFQLMAAVQISWLFMEDPDVKGRRLMLQGRNKGGKKRSYKYEITSVPWPVDVCGSEDLKDGETSDGVGLVVFKGETDVTANDILERKLEKGGSAIGRVRCWIEEVLANGPVGTDKCWQEARTRGFDADAVNKACSQLNIERNKKTWNLPTRESIEVIPQDGSLFTPDAS